MKLPRGLERRVTYFDKTSGAGTYSTWLVRSSTQTKTGKPVDPLPDNDHSAGAVYCQHDLWRNYTGWKHSVDHAHCRSGRNQRGCVRAFHPIADLSGTFSTLTPAGEEQSMRWKGFAEYLKQVSKGKEPAISADAFERYLAYAAVFGLGAHWAKYFQQQAVYLCRSGFMQWQAVTAILAQWLP